MGTAKGKGPIRVFLETIILVSKITGLTLEEVADVYDAAQIVGKADSTVKDALEQAKGTVQ